MPRWWQELHGVNGLVFHDEIILAPDNYEVSPKNKWAHFKMTRQRDLHPSTQKISKEMFRRIHPCQNNSVNVHNRTEMQSLPTRSGCYAVIRERQVLYVGASSNLRTRCYRFLRKGEKTDRLYFWLWRYPYSLEHILISFLAPKNNCHGKYNKFPTICAWTGKFREELET